MSEAETEIRLRKAFDIILDEALKRHGESRKNARRDKG